MIKDWMWGGSGVEEEGGKIGLKGWDIVGWEGEGYRLRECRVEQE